MHNALGYAYLSMDRAELAVTNFQRAVDLQPGYVTAWNNLGDALERRQEWAGALDAYERSLSCALRPQLLCDRHALCLVLGARFVSAAPRFCVGLFGHSRPAQCHLCHGLRSAHTRTPARAVLATTSLSYVTVLQFIFRFWADALDVCKRSLSCVALP